MLGYELDAAFVEQKIAIEIDGFAWHRDVARFNHDARRGNVLAAAGWIVLHYTWHQLVGEPERVLREVRDLLRQRTSGDPVRHTVSNVGG
jgi:very-short-patch-repair endonuclease